MELIDLYPTLCDLVGIGTPAHVQGQSFAKLLDEPERSHRESAYSSYPHNAGKEIGPVVGHSLRTGRYRYTEWWQRKSDQVLDRMLTEIAADPGELTNSLETQPTLVADLSKQLRQRVLGVRPWVELFNGKDLSGWKTNTDPGAFQVVDGVIRAQATDPKERSHLFYVGADPDTLETFKDFELEAVVRS
ncbi:MAG: arylsulfatase A-like enzyme [Verrucomicrobiales bacterium]